MLDVQLLARGELSDTKKKVCISMLRFSFESVSHNSIKGGSYSDDSTYENSYRIEDFANKAFLGSPWLYILLPKRIAYGVYWNYIRLVTNGSSLRLRRNFAFGTEGKTWRRG